MHHRLETIEEDPEAIIERTLSNLEWNEEGGRKWRNLKNQKITDIKPLKDTDNVYILKDEGTYKTVINIIKYSKFLELINKWEPIEKDPEAVIESFLSKRKREKERKEKEEYDNTYDEFFHSDRDYVQNLGLIIWDKIMQEIFDVLENSYWVEFMTMGFTM